jgi:PAS domain S-box-containing protein
VFLGLNGWPQPERTLEFSGLILAAILASAAAGPSTAEDRAIMPPSFVIDFTALLLFGPSAAMMVAAAGAVTQALADPQAEHPLRRLFSNAATVLFATQAAGFAHLALGGTIGQFAWPWQGVPIAGALAAYCVVKGASALLIAPFVMKRPVAPSWRRDILRCVPNYFVGASLAVALVEVIDRRAWDLLPVAAVPLLFVYRAYCAHLDRLEEQHRRRQVLDALDEGMSVVDGNGRIVVWNDALERILSCPRERALGSSLVVAVPGLAKTDLPRAIDEALTRQSPQTLTQLGLTTAGRARILQVRVFPVAGGATLLWLDVTDRARAEHALKRSEERLALAAEGAKD